MYVYVYVCVRVPRSGITAGAGRCPRGRTWRGASHGEARGGASHGEARGARAKASARDQPLYFLADTSVSLLDGRRAGGDIYKQMGHLIRLVFWSRRVGGVNEPMF